MKIRLAEMGADGLWDVSDRRASVGVGGGVLTRCLGQFHTCKGLPHLKGAVSSFGGVGALPSVMVP